MTAPLNSNNPFVPPIEDTKQGIQTLAMFYYQSLLDAGFDATSAKQQVADLLEKQYYQFCEKGDLAFKNLATVDRKLTMIIKIIEQHAENNPSLRSVYNDLLSIQAQIKR